MDPLSVLAIAAAAWVAIHVALAGSPARSWFVARFGENAFRGMFSLLSAAVLVGLVVAYRRAPCSPLWITPRWLLFLPIALMPGALVLFAGSFMVKNPTVVGGEPALERDEPGRGVLRITRHPFLWAVATWSTAHLIVNGSVASQLFFGSMALTALQGTRDIDRKRRRTNAASYARYEAVTSNVPFAAILAGRNRLVVRELVPALAVGAALTVMLVMFHRDLFHVSPIP